MMTVCKTCHHWRHIRDGDFEDWPAPHGECGLFDEDSQEQPAWISPGVIVAYPWLQAEDTGLITKPEFGCNQWELGFDE